MHYETKVGKFSLFGFEEAWKALISVSYRSKMATVEEFNQEISRFEHHYGKSEENNHMDWEANEVRQTVETENQRYTVIFGVLQSKRQRLKITKIVKIREETIVGVRLTRILYIAQKGNQFYVHNQTVAGLIPRKQKLLTDSEFYLNFTGTTFHLPEGYKFKYYQNAVECWVHNNILQDPHQLHILVKANFKKFVRALERIRTRPTTRTTWNFTEGQNVSPFESSSEEEDSVDDENRRDDEDCEDGEDCEGGEGCEDVIDSENDENYEDDEGCEDGRDSGKEDEDAKGDEEKSTAEEDYDADDEESSQQDPDDSDDNSSVAFDGLDWLCDENRSVCGNGFDADVERIFEDENVKDDFGGCGDCSSDSLEVYDGVRCLFGEGNDVCCDKYDDFKDGCGDLGHDSLVGCDGFKLLYDRDSFDDLNNGVEAVENDVAVKDDVSCDSEDDGLVGCDGFLLLYGDDKDVQCDSFNDDKERYEAVENDVDFEDDGRVNLDDDDFVGFDGFEYLYDKDNEICGDGFEDVKNSLEAENNFDVKDNFEDGGDFVGVNVDGFDRFGCFTGEDSNVCDDGVDLSDVQHSPEVKNDFDFDELEKKEEARDISKGGDCGPVRKEVEEREHYDMQKKEEVNGNTRKDEGKPRKQKVKKRKNLFTGWICGKILKVFVKGKVLL